MILLTHIAIALASLGLTALNLFRPTNKKLQTAYGLLAATFLSGSFLILSANAPLKSVCVSGLTYATVAISGALYSRRKLAYKTVPIKNDRVRD